MRKSEQIIYIPFWNVFFLSTSCVLLCFNTNLRSFESSLPTLIELFYMDALFCDFNYLVFQLKTHYETEKELVKQSLFIQTSRIP